MAHDDEVYTGVLGNEEPTQAVIEVKTQEDDLLEAIRPSLDKLHTIIDEEIASVDKISDLITARKMGQSLEAMVEARTMYIGMLQGLKNRFSEDLQ